MKYVIFFSLAFYNIIVFAQPRGDLYKDAVKSGSGNIVYTYAETPGFSYVNSSGQLDGICLDIMKAFEAYLKEEKGIETNVEISDATAGNFRAFLGEIKLATGGSFGLGNVTITDARKKSYFFSPPFITNIAVFITHKDTKELSSLENIGRDFAEKKAYTVKNSTNEEFILEVKNKYYPALEIVYVDSFSEVLSKVLADKSSFANIDFTYWLDALKDKKPIKRHPAGDERSEQFGIIMPRSNDWAPVLSDFFNSGFIGSTEYKKIIAKHLGNNALQLLGGI
ncbi:MAG: transporter substrate-binding domain-containing protein [Bacteroidota bacterium]